jgi:hypothetical protein
VKIDFVVFRVFNPKEGGNMILQTFGIQPPHYIAWQPRKGQILRWHS